MFLRYHLCINMLFIFISGTSSDCCGGGLRREKKASDDHEGDGRSYFGQFASESTHCQQKGSCDSVVKPKRENTLVKIPAGDYQMGTDELFNGEDNEQPKRILPLQEFYIDKYEVSNEEFLKFVEDTNYETEAEKYGDSFVFKLFLNDTYREKLNSSRSSEINWWYKVNGTDWRHPSGPDSSITDLMDHPVAHVSWNDAKAYCSWRGARLPTELEWEAACRGGHQDRMFPWGNELYPQRKHMANIWQGAFPDTNYGKDGYIGSSPVHSYEQNDFGLHNMVGNVWEWTEDTWEGLDKVEKIMKGGSYMCHRSYCYRFRCSARTATTRISSSPHLGFRCVNSTYNV